MLRNVQENSATEAFPGWRYHPAYFDESRYFHVGENASELAEPLCVQMPFDLTPAREVRRNAWAVTDVTVHVKCERPSRVLRIVDQVPGLSIRVGQRHLLEISIAGEAKRQALDLRPEMPLIIHGC